MCAKYIFSKDFEQCQGGFQNKRYKMEKQTTIIQETKVHFNLAH